MNKNSLEVLEAYMMTNCHGFKYSIFKQVMYVKKLFLSQWHEMHGNEGCLTGSISSAQGHENIACIFWTRHGSLCNFK